MVCNLSFKIQFTELQLKPNNQTIISKKISDNSDLFELLWLEM
jgi:hypothetical protein